MSATLGDKKVFSLYEVANSIRKTIAARYGSDYWVKAEMNKLNYYQYSGHCYPDLIEKSDGKVIAQFRAVLWSRDYQRINAQFLKLLHEPLKDGIKILFLANVTYDPVHGMALRIVDIDAGFTLGDLEREKQETISRLRAENIFYKNKQLPFPLLPKRIAIISVETSKGYADFLKIIHNNAWGYHFFHFLFPSLLQGEKAVEAMLGQLRRIKKVIHHFDVVVIIRGGGGEVGLSCYNDYRLAKAIALFPIPVLTGIGHATNETVVEMVACTNAITPTKIAEYLMQKFHDFAEPVRQAREIIVGRTERLISEEKNAFAAAIKSFRFGTRSLLGRYHQMLAHAALKAKSGSAYLFKDEHQSLSFQQEKITDKAQVFLNRQATALEALEKNIRIMDPKHVLKRGYSITRLNGHALTTADELKAGDQLRTVLFEGTVSSIVQSVKKDNDETR